MVAVLLLEHFQNYNFTTPLCSILKHRVRLEERQQSPVIAYSDPYIIGDNVHMSAANRCRACHFQHLCESICHAFGELCRWTRYH